MEKRFIKRLGKEISLLGFGTMRLPILGDKTENIDYATAQKMVDYALDMGVNYFDTAWSYHGGLSETFIGGALKKHPRERFYLADKLPTWAIGSTRDAERIFAEQLKKCQVEYFDFYLVHTLNEEFYKIYREFDLFELLEKKKNQGLIRHLGFSFHDTPALLARIADEHPWDFAQIQLNYLDWETCDAKGQYEALTQRDIPVIVMEPVRGGALATLNENAAGILRKADPTVSLASWAIRYAASLPNVMTVLSGMSTPEQVEDNIRTMTPFRPLSEAEHATVDKAAAAFRASGTIPCTGCRYCMDCPSGVDIPRVFSIYNLYCVSHNPYVFRNTFNSMRASERASSCTSCGACLKLCPQGIDIPTHMKEITELTLTIKF